jgi:hypothetical protein
MTVTNRKKEIAKFFCGWEALHTVVHAYFWFSGATLTVFGITQTPKLNMLGVAVNVVICLALGIYAWRTTPSSLSAQNQKHKYER